MVIIKVCTFVSLCISTMLCYLSAYPPTINGILKNASQESGYAYVYTFPKQHWLDRVIYTSGDDSSSNYNIKLWQDGVLLTNNAMHNDIRQLGDGRYSAGGNALYLSTLKNVPLQDIKIQYERTLQPNSVLSYAILFSCVTFLILLVIMCCLMPRGRVRHCVIISSILCIAALNTYLYFFPALVKGDLHYAKQAEGKAYKYQLAKLKGLDNYLYRFDSKDNYGELRIWQDGVLLTKSRQMHSVISSQGDGRFAVWNGDILFSTINNVALVDVESMHFELEQSPGYVIIWVFCILCMLCLVFPLYLLKNITICKIN